VQHDDRFRRQSTGMRHRAKHASSRRDPATAHRAEGEALIFGIHAVQAALQNDRRVITRLFLTDNAERRLGEALTARGVTHEGVHPKDLDRRLGPDTVHQGALMESVPLPEPTLAELIEHGAGRPLLVLDQVTDPHNVGAILRSAAVFGSAGLILTRRNSPPLDGALAKSASGALEHVPVALVQNLARAMSELKELGCTLIGLDGEAPDCLEQLPWPEHAALVFGAEGKGLRHLTRENCDRLCRIASDGILGSLNVSNAAAIVLHWAAAGRLKLIPPLG
jgi:23S rRNA (guanosine2251-2'-O)-methyltransferase